MLFQDSIEARFGGDRLMPTVKQLDEVVTHRGDVVAVQVYKRHVTDADNLSVARFEVATVGDGSIHEALDLTHDSEKKGNSCSQLVSGSSATFGGEFCTLKVSKQEVEIVAGVVILSDERAVESTLKGSGVLGELSRGDVDVDHGWLSELRSV